MLVVPLGWSGEPTSKGASMTDHNHAQRQETAAVVLYWMQRRGMTRQIFADRMGKSLSWVDKIRAGDRQLDRLSVLRQIADVLDIPLAILIDPEEAERQRTCPDEREIDAIRHALRQYDAITNVFRSHGDVLPEPNLAKLERTVRFGWMAFQATNYQVIGQLLADLIRDAQAAVWQLDGGQQRQAKTDMTLIGSAARRVAHALSATHQSDDAVQLVKSAASRLEPHLRSADPAFISAYGMLLWSVSDFIDTDLGCQIC
jgi:transcriptional regulator with XRE-family HTH domain